VTQIGDQLDSLLSQVVNRLVSRAPVELVRPDMGFVVCRPIPKRLNTKVANEVEILTPALVMTALLHLVDAPTIR
jgi:hypothetical protein